MTADAPPEDDWMPVFVVQAKPPTVRSRGPDKETAGAEPAQTWQRVGTAFLDRDGTWHVGVTVVPLNGRFVMRPPRPGEARDDVAFT